MESILNNIGYKGNEVFVHIDSSKVDLEVIEGIYISYLLVFIGGDDKIFKEP